jgi:integrase
VAIPKATAHALTHLLTQEKAKATRLGLLPWNDDRPVFTDGAAQQIRPDWFSDQVRAATTAAKVPPLTAHSLRHSNGTILAEDGVDVLTISRHLGHSSTRVTESVYIHELAARERTAADALDKLIS